jgi:hypothetical protein
MSREISAYGRVAPQAHLDHFVEQRFALRGVGFQFKPGLLEFMHGGSDFYPTQISDCPVSPREWKTYSG